ncbi:TetR/AcrR family transcriptional regulator [Sphingobium sufflavum]|uniref:TetR/AcrR family transcriptional regulator n=1 Tax=Sphingobium sufflavum TaxID=1129547 RepID=UPI001F32F3C9|nr:TetR/AcrR family transcriptional regulator [Sphingobium sufflavum]MCE7797220.1 TetR/AcrR family transcriptional regulator [Sphingobium sufflavum]
MNKDEAPGRRRNKGFDTTHQAIIEAAVRLISEKGVEALSMAAISRAVGINRTTLYYHFEDRDAMIVAVKLWSSEQLSKGFEPDVPQQERIDYISRFVLENAELIKLWFEDFVSPGDIRDRYPRWDELVRGTAATLNAAQDDAIDAEVYCTILLTSAFIAPRVYHMTVRPDLSLKEVTERFRKEQQRVLRRDSLFRV